uniref:Uncharacterized protein n=1 Tax=Lactuca sativa TaxID=4236 RepID=A0A9R1XKJ0_LACSA|nr:hypothetical protein LSAT_V11C300124640 [Lactuca sativa]
MLLKESELELENEFVRNLNQISYAVWLAGNGIEINSRICLVRKKWNWNSSGGDSDGDDGADGGSGGGGGDSGDGGSVGSGGGGSVISGRSR